MVETSIKQFAARYVTISHEEGHEFEFEAHAMNRTHPVRLFAERWKNKRLPLNANVCRLAARTIAEQRFRDGGLI